MRVIKNKTFLIGGKIPYSEWPELIHRFMCGQSLTSKKFLYYFSDLLILNGCSRLVKDLPEIGGPREYNDGRTYKEYIITNIDTGNGCTETQILPLMKKLHRSYGLSNCDLYYLDVDFFHDLIPSGRSLKAHHRDTDEFIDPLYLIDDQPYGSGFRLHRDRLGNNCLKMSIDILHNDTAMDPEPYFAAMEKLLPGIRSIDTIEIYSTNEERKTFCRYNEAAMPLLERCYEWLDERLTGVDKQNNFSSNYNLAPKLKKLAKTYGFEYSYCGCGIYALSYRTKKGHIFQLSADSGPSRYDTAFDIIFQGLGFYFPLGGAMFVPTNQQEFDACAEKAVETAYLFRKELLPLLDQCWPETPAWYIPDWYSKLYYPDFE